MKRSMENEHCTTITAAGIKWSQLSGATRFGCERLSVSSALAERCLADQTERFLCWLRSLIGMFRTSLACTLLVLLLPCFPCCCCSLLSAVGGRLVGFACSQFGALGHQQQTNEQTDHSKKLAAAAAATISFPPPRTQTHTHAHTHDISDSQVRSRCCLLGDDRYHTDGERTLGQTAATDDPPAASASQPLALRVRIPVDGRHRVACTRRRRTADSGRSEHDQERATRTVPQRGMEYLALGALPTG